MTFQEFITSTNEADAAAVLTQLLQLHAAYSITCQAADFVEVCITDVSVTLQLLSCKTLTFVLHDHF